MNICKKWFLFVLVLPIPFILVLIVLLYIYDSLMLYHKPWFREYTELKNQRFIAASIIKNKSFDSVILGTSMTERMPAEEASEKLSGQWVNLSSNGSFLNERVVLLRYILENKKMKNIIF